jgi:hypothetical protein
MLIWRLVVAKDDIKSSSQIDMACHVQKRNGMYRLMMRINGLLVVDETHPSIFPVACRAEQLRQEARPPTTESNGALNHEQRR